jgi:hypothetical protein
MELTGLRDGQHIFHVYICVYLDTHYMRVLLEGSITVQVCKIQKIYSPA